MPESRDNRSGPRDEKDPRMDTDIMKSLKKYKNDFIYALAFLLTIFAFSACNLIKPSQKELEKQENKKFAKSVISVSIRGFRDEETREVEKKAIARFSNGRYSILGAKEKEDDNFDLYFENSKYSFFVDCAEGVNDCREFTASFTDRKQNRSAQIHNKIFRPQHEKPDTKDSNVNNAELLSRILYHELRDNSDSIEFRSWTEYQVNKSYNDRAHISLFVRIVNWTPFETTNDPNPSDNDVPDTLQKHITMEGLVGNNAKVRIERKITDEFGSPFGSTNRYTGTYTGSILMDSIESGEQLDNNNFRYDIKLSRKVGSNSLLKLKKVCFNDFLGECQ